MLPRSFFVTSLLSLCFAGAAVVGCAAPTDSADAEESAAETSDDLTTAAKDLVGHYYTHSAPSGTIARLTLDANGKYTAEVDPAGKIVCVTAPCLLPESGTWNAYKSAGKLRIRLRPTGEASRWYEAERSATELTLTRGGQSDKLYALDANQCLDDADCSANESCGPKYCLMYCALNDPFCCGPSTCQPKNPPPLKKVCGGFAGLPCGAGEKCVDDPSDSCDPTKGGADCSGICVPDSPPPPPPTCGPITCGAGEVCCNPLSGICTKPGEFCAL